MKTDHPTPYAKALSADREKAQEAEDKNYRPIKFALADITPLPWPVTFGDAETPSFEYRPNWDYARHAANMLPELVDAASKVLKRIESSGVEWECADDLRAELARAENVETQP